MRRHCQSIFRKSIKQHSQTPDSSRADSRKQAQISSFFNPSTIKATFLSLVLAITLVFPAQAHAGFFSFIGEAFSTNTAAAQAESEVVMTNSQNVALLQATPVIDPKTKTVDSLSIIDDSALVAESGPLGTAADVALDMPASDQISVYVVHKGDTIGDIAKMFSVSANTIYWANDVVKGQALKEGQTLVILPVTGVKYTVKKGDTLAGIAKKFSADADDIAKYNGISADTLAIGEEIIVPDGEMSASASKVSPSASSSKASYSGYYIKPIPCRLTQNIHGNGGVDMSCGTSGTAIKAAASGTVIVANKSGWGGGYGSYVVIKHPNGTQTLYAHMSKVAASVGQSVSQGEVIGYVGNTGKSTGPHLHFEVRGAKNPGSNGSWASR